MGTLLERAEPLELMAAGLRAARGGRGGSIVIGGEAGIGKTALVDAFVHEHCAGTRVLWGTCESLATPQPLGPFLDIAGELDEPALHRSDVGEPLHRWLRDLLAALRRLGPAIVVVEDAHWIDDASADGFKFLARRVSRSPLLLLATLRETETPAGHPMRRALADVPTDHLTHIRARGAVARVGCSARAARRAAARRPARAERRQPVHRRRAAALRGRRAAEVTARCDAGPPESFG